MSRKVNSKISLTRWLLEVNSNLLTLLLTCLGIFISIIVYLVDKASSSNNNVAETLLFPVLVLSIIFIHSLLSLMPRKDKQAFDLNLVDNILFLIFSLNIVYCVWTFISLLLPPLWLSRDYAFGMIVRFVIAIIVSLTIMIRLLKHNNFELKFLTRKIF